MKNTRKTAIAAALTMAMATGTAVASPLFWAGDFTGSFTMLDPDGGFVSDDPAGDTRINAIHAS